MPQITLRWKSASLGHATETIILAPDPRAVPPPWNTLYLLHGRSDDATTWTRNTSLERQAEGFPLLVVMPSGYISYYRDPIGGKGVESAIIADLMPMIEAMFPVRAERGARAISGLSMGGYGALYLGLKHSNLFGAISSHSAAVIERNRHDNLDRQHRLDLIFGDPMIESETLFGLIARTDAATAAQIRVDCGDRDPLLEENRELHARLDEQGIKHTYVERPGAHDWNYWDRQVGETLRFCMTVLR